MIWYKNYIFNIYIHIMLKIGMFFSFKYWIVICFLMFINLKIELQQLIQFII